MRQRGAASAGPVEDGRRPMGLGPACGRADVDPELEAIFGLEPGAIKCYADFRDRVDPDDIEKVEAERDAAIRRRDQFNLEFRIIRSDGKVRWILAMGAHSTTATGEPIRILGNKIDITERKEAEIALAERDTPT